MPSDRMLFDRVLEQALGGETVDSLMDKNAHAVERGDWERVRLLDEMLRAAVLLGNHAVMAKKLNRNRT